jgi:hypothetical protein
VDLARFERATSTFAESRSNSTELQIRKIGNDLAEGEGVEPSRRNARPGFQDQLRATARHLPNLARTLRFELRTSILETDGLPVSLHPFMNPGACGRTRTYDSLQGLLIYSQVLLLLSHACKFGLGSLVLGL